MILCPLRIFFGGVIRLVVRRGSSDFTGNYISLAARENGGGAEAACAACGEGWWHLGVDKEPTIAFLSFV